MHAALGTGVRTGRTFCDVLSGREASGGIIVRLPKHTGPATLTSTCTTATPTRPNREGGPRVHALHRHRRRADLDNTLLTRAVIQSEFRKEADLFDRIAATGARA